MLITVQTESKNLSTLLSAEDKVLILKYNWNKQLQIIIQNLGESDIYWSKYKPANILTSWKIWTNANISLSCSLWDLSNIYFISQVENINVRIETL